MKKEQLDKILADHALWLRGQGGSMANLQGVDLRGADLQGADLREADLRKANLQGANLWEVDLQNADLQGANLSNTDLQNADLREVNLREANLNNVKFSPYQIAPEEGSFIAYKKTSNGVICVMIPEDALRVNAIGSRKIRVSKLNVLSGNAGKSPTHNVKINYEIGSTYEVDNFNDDVREECAPGLHVFITRQEAEDW